ncbi:hypothetical protein ZPAH1_orf00092 [Aeromonas phage ZPAH1]|nr:hypothetical protein ASwh1_44 [Aeromonas phage Aswh_1]QQG33854.1 hypothetical protein ZPAH1_orf00092 [Aeromonas phage ZPAH1]
MIVEVQQIEDIEKLQKYHDVFSRLAILTKNAIEAVNRGDEKFELSEQDLEDMNTVNMWMR